jgi:allantoinase
MAMTCDLVVTGDLVLTDRVIPGGFVAVSDGKVVALGSGRPPAAEERHDHGSALILPGVIDSHVHSRSQAGHEGFSGSSRSAAAGGVTTIVDMPYDDGDLIASADRVRAKIADGEAGSRVDFALYGTCHPEEGPRRVAEMVEAGVAAFKFSTFGTHPIRFPRLPPQTLADCFAAIAPFGLPAGVHNEHHELVLAATERVKAEGPTDYRAHGLARPELAETLAMTEIYEIGAATGCHAHVVHCSVGRGYDLARAWREMGHRATVEACIHYLILSEEDDVSRLLGMAKVNPPIRSRIEREKLWAHLAAGNVTIVSSDHVSWTADRKTDPDILKNASGVPGLEVLLPLLVKGLIERNLPLTWAARLLAENPARHFQLSHRKGALAVGRDADIAVLVARPKRYRAAESGHNAVDWSPYDGIELPMTVAATYRRGEMIFDGTRVLAKEGSGRFLRPLGRGAA